MFVIPVFASMFADFGAKLPAPTQFLIDLSDFMVGYWWLIAALGTGAVFALRGYVATPAGRVHKDHLLLRAPIFGGLMH